MLKQLCRVETGQQAANAAAAAHRTCAGSVFGTPLLVAAAERAEYTGVAIESTVDGRKVGERVRTRDRTCRMIDDHRGIPRVGLSLTVP